MRQPRNALLRGVAASAPFGTLVVALVGFVPAAASCASAPLLTVQASNGGTPFQGDT